MLSEGLSTKHTMQWVIALVLGLALLGGAHGDAWAQSGGSFSVTITVQEAGQNAVTLRYGIAGNATDEVNGGLGEVELPPLPPSGNFDARFTTPNGAGLSLDLRNNDLSGSADRQWQLNLLKVVGSANVTISWDPASLPSNVGTFSVTDAAGGFFGLNVPDMRQASSATFSNSLATTVLFNATTISSPPIEVFVPAHGDTLVGDTKDVVGTIGNPHPSENLTINSISISGDADFSLVSPPSTPFTINVGDPAQNLTVRFAPASTGAKTGTVTVNYTSGGTTADATAALSGTGVVLPTPDIRVSLTGTDTASVTTVNVGTAALDDSSQVQVNIGNTGDDTLFVSNVAISGTHSSQFVLVNAPSVPDTILAGDSTVVTVRFRHTASDGAKTASLDITSDDPNENPLNVSLTATATGGAPTIAVADTPVVYGDRTVLTNNDTTFSIDNTGRGVLTVSSVTVGGANAAEFPLVSPSFPVTIHPDSPAVSVTVRFTPAFNEANKAATYTISHDAGGGDIVVNASGNGVGGAADVDANTPLAFGNVAVGGNSDLGLAVRNTGTDTLFVSNLSISGTHSAQFTLQSPPAFPDTILAGDSTVVTVRFTPVNVDAKTATLAIASNDGDENPFNVALTGTGTGGTATIAVADTPVVFLDTTVGATLDDTLTIDNTGTGSLSVTAITPGGTHGAQFTIVSPSIPITLHPDSPAVAVTVRFTPVTPGGTKTGTLTIAHNAGGDIVVNTSGNAIEPAVEVFPTTITFDSADVNTSKTQTFVIRSTGTAQLDVTNVALGGANADQFSVNPTTANIAIGDSATITVTFTPTSTGAKTATVSITDNAPQNPTVTLNGVGKQAGISVAPTALSFPETAVNDTSAARELTITNTGDDTLEVTGMPITGADADQFFVSPDDTIKTVAPGDTAVVLVFHAPTSAGTKTATLAFNDNAPQDPTVPLSSTRPIREVAPDSLTFATTAVGGSADLTFTIGNNAGATADLVIDSLRIVGAEASSFSIVSPVSGFPITIPAGGTATTVTARFSPQPAPPTTKIAFVEIYDNDITAGVPDSVKLIGNVTRPNIVVSLTDSLTFANTLVDSTSTQTFSVSNAGDAQLTLTSVGFTGGDAGLFSVTPVDGQIAAGDSIVFTATFTPASFGIKNTTLNIRHNDFTTEADSTSSFGVRGIGGQAEIAVSLGTIVYPDSTVVQGTRDTTITVSNPAQGAFPGPLHVNITFGGTNPNDFLASPAAFVVAPDSSRTVTVTFRPTQINLRQALLVLNHNAASDTTVVTLSGNGKGIPIIAKVLYYDTFSNPTPIGVDSAVVSVLTFVPAISAADGRYSLAVPPGTHTVNIAKAADLEGGNTKDAILGSDALLILLHTAFLTTQSNSLSADQLVAGDVDGDDRVTNADALGILRYLAFFRTDIKNVGQWEFDPASYTITMPGGTAPDSKGYLLGDVLPNYKRSVSTKPSVLAMNLDASGAAWRDDRLVLPIRVSGAEAVESLLLSLEYDTEQFRYSGARLTEAGQDYLMVDNGQEEGKVHIAMAGLPKQGADGALLELEFEVTQPIVPGQTPERLQLPLNRFIVNDVDLSGGPGAVLDVRVAPDAVELSQNYPNPFNPQTQIQFGLPEQMQVRLTIYNALGQEVRVLTDEELPAGYHTVVWDGRTAKGRLASSGVYLYHLRTSSGFAETRRMLLLK